MKFENVFQDICDTLIAEESVMFESLGNIYDMETLNTGFFESVGVETFFTEGIDIKSYATKAKDVIVKAIKFMIEQLKKFAKMIADRVEDFMAKHKIKQMIKQAKADAKKYNGAKMSFSCDPLSIIKLSQEYAKACMKQMNEIISCYKAGNLTEDKEEKFQKQYEKALDKFETELAKYRDKNVVVAYNQGLQIMEKVNDYIQNSNETKQFESKLESVAREFESFGFKFYDPKGIVPTTGYSESFYIDDENNFEKFLESVGSNTSTEEFVMESGKESVAPNKFCALLDSLVATFRANKGKCITAFLQDVFAVAFSSSAIHNVTQGHLLSAGINAGLGVALGAPGARKTSELSKEVYDRYKNTKIQ